MGNASKIETNDRARIMPKGRFKPKRSWDRVIPQYNHLPSGVSVFTGWDAPPPHGSLTRQRQEAEALKAKPKR